MDLHLAVRVTKAARQINLGAGADDQLNQRGLSRNDRELCFALEERPP